MKEQLGGIGITMILPVPVHTSGGRDVVYRVRLSATMAATVSLCGSYFNTVLHIYRNACPSAGGVLVCCNDDGGCPGGPNPFASCCPNVTFIANTNYFIIVDGYDDVAAGHYILNIQPSSTFCQFEHCAGIIPPNDACLSRIGLPNPNVAAQWLQGWTIGAAMDNTPVCNNESQVAPGVWYSIIGNGETITVTTCDNYSDFNTKISVFCNDCEDLICVTANDNFNIPVCGYTSLVTWCSEPGKEYFVLVHGGFNWEVGKFRIGYWSDGALCTPYPVCTSVPSNDLCENALLLATPGTPYSVMGTTIGATVDNAPCCVNAQTAPGVWYYIIGNGTTLTISTCNPYTSGQNWDTKLSVYCNTCTNLSCVDGNNDWSGCILPGGLSQVSWCSVAGEQYYILVHGNVNATGNFALEVSSDNATCSTAPPCLISSPPPNDNCENATVLASVSVVPQSIRGSTIGASQDNASFCVVADAGSGVWYKLTGDGHEIWMTTCNEYTQCIGYDTRLSVYCGDCNGLTCVTGNDDLIPCPPMSEVIWCSEPGREYYILVHGIAGSVGNFQLDWWEDSATCTDYPVCATTGDSCADAKNIPSIPYCDEGTTWWYADNYAPPCAPLAGGRDRVYKIRLDYTELVTVSLCGSYFNTVLHIWMGCPDAGGTMICCNDDFMCAVDGTQSCCTDVVFMANTTYYIIVDGNGAAAAGHYILNIAQTSSCPAAHCLGLPPPNDSCEVAFGLPNPGIVPQWFNGWTIGATLDNAPVCNGEAQVAPGVWYSIDGTGNTMTVTTCDPYTDYDTKISVYCFECEYPVCVTANDNFNIPVCGYTSLVTWCSEPGRRYYILVHGGSPIELGNFKIGYWDDGLSCSPYPNCYPPPPPNDLCRDAITLIGSSTTPQSVLGTTVGATADNAPFCVVTDLAPGVWYKIIGNGTTITATTCNTYTQNQGYDTRLSVYCNDCEDLMCVTGNDDWPGCVPMSEVSWCSELGREYYVLVHGGTALAWGRFELDWWDDGALCDNPSVCTNAIPDFSVVIDCCHGPTILAGSTINAGNECYTRPSNEQIWELHLPYSCEYKFDMCDSPNWNSYLYLDATVCAATHIASDDDGCLLVPGLSYIDCVHLAAGTYYLMVEGFTAADQGDYVIKVSCCCDIPPVDQYDMGDLRPCNYPTLPGNPAHALTGIAWLGSTVSPELTPRVINLDIGDDGVTFPAWPWPLGPVPINVRVTPGPRYFYYAQECCGCLWLNGWMDINNDGDFTDDFPFSSEWIIQDALVTPGTYNFIVNPFELVSEPGPCGIFRFRLTSLPVGRLGFGKMDPACPTMIGGTFDMDYLGEVEDYILAANPYNLVVWPLVGSEHTHIKLDWQAAACGLTYWIYRDTICTFTPSPATLIATTTALTYSDTVITTSLIPIPRYFYQVTASNP